MMIVRFFYGGGTLRRTHTRDENWGHSRVISSDTKEFVGPSTPGVYRQITYQSVGA